MPKDGASGAAAREWGLATARHVAGLIGARPLRRGSNECVRYGRQVVIKCARRNTHEVGVSFKMLERVERILGAFEDDDGVFQVLSLGREAYERTMRPAKNKGLVSRRVFEERGERVARVTLE